MGAPGGRAGTRGWQLAPPVAPPCRPPAAGPTHWLPRCRALPATRLVPNALQLPDSHLLWPSTSPAPDVECHLWQLAVDRPALRPQGCRLVHTAEHHSIAQRCRAAALKAQIGAVIAITDGYLGNLDILLTATLSLERNITKVASRYIGMWGSAQYCLCPNRVTGRNGIENAPSYKVGMMLVSAESSTCLHRTARARQEPICTGGGLLRDRPAAAACTKPRACAAESALQHLHAPPVSAPHEPRQEKPDPVLQWLGGKKFKKSNAHAGAPY